MACAVLLAFADLGIHLPSRRERVLGRVRSAAHLGCEPVAEFLDLCLDAHLLVSQSPGCLQLSGEEARALEDSLDGPSPVPDVQASQWVERLRTCAT